MTKPILFNFSDAELNEFVEKIGQPKFRAKQIREWLMRGAPDFSVMKNIPEKLRNDLTDCAQTLPVKIVKKLPVFPKVNNDICVKCGLCEKNCPVLNHKNEQDLNHDIFITFAEDTETRFNGSSGGMFGLIAKHIIGEGGVVYGAAFDENLKLKCTSALEIE